MHPAYKLYARIFAHPKFARWNHILHRMALHGLGILNFDEQLSGEKWFIREYISRPEKLTCIDVGANAGNFSRYLLQECPKCKIHAFEPHSENFKKLSKLERVCNVNQALSDKAGRTKIYDYAAEGENDHEHASLHETVFSELYKKEYNSFEIEVTTLDAYCTDHQIDSIDFLKIDTEGHELNVLKGSRHLIESGRIKIILFEFNEMNALRGIFLSDFKRLLPDHNLYRLLPKALLPVPEEVVQSEIFAYQNIVCLPKKCFSETN